MLDEYEDERALCGAAYGRDGDRAVLVFHPAVTPERRRQYARVLLTCKEFQLWEATHPR